MGTYAFRYSLNLHIIHTQTVNLDLAGYTCQGVETRRLIVGNRSPERAVRISVCTPKTLESLSKDY